MIIYLDGIRRLRYSNGSMIMLFTYLGEFDAKYEAPVFPCTNPVPARPIASGKNFGNATFQLQLKFSEESTNH